MVYYPCRKIIGLIGFISFGIVIVLTYKYLATSRFSYAICDVIAIGLSVFLLMPFFRNQVVEVVDKSITIRTFGKARTLTADNLESISRSKDGATSYRFSKDGRRYQVTPDVYTNSEIMLEEFAQIFDIRKKKKSNKS